MIRWLIVLLILAATAAHAQSPCDGRITDKLDHDMTANAVAKPAAGNSYVDPVFGTLITRITNSNPATDGANAVRKTVYSRIRGWNADGSQIMLWSRAGGGRRYEFYQGDAPYALLGTVTFDGSATFLYSMPPDIEHILWDPVLPNVVWYPSGDSRGGANPNARLMKMTLNWPSAPTFEQQRTFDTFCNDQGITQNYVLSLGGAQDMSHTSSKVVSFRCGSLGKTGFNDLNFAYSITTDTIIGYYMSTAGTPATPMSSARGFMVFQGYSATPRWKVADASLAYTAVTSQHYPEHDGMVSTATEDFHVRAGFDGPGLIGSAIATDLSDGSEISLVGTSNGWPYPPNGSHNSYGALNGSGWFAFGNVGNGNGDSVLNGEIVLVNAGSGEVCRIAHSRTFEETHGGTWDYWAETHPVISPDGYRVIFNSDFQKFATGTTTPGGIGVSSVDAYVIDLRPQDTTIITAALPNGVTTEAYSKTLQALGGVGAPYDWTKTAGTWPDGISMGTDGIITGTPTTVETQIVTVQACDGDSPPVCDTQQLTLVIQQRPSIVQSSPLAAATVGTSYGVNLTATGGVPSYTWSLATGTMCAGLTLGSDGSISGTPITLQTCNVTARVTDSHAQPISQTKAFSITVALPSACLPGGSGVCMRLFPSATKVYARYGQRGLPSGAACTAAIKLNGTEVQSFGTQHAFSKRPVLFTGLNPGTLYTIEVLCAGLDDLASDVVTTAASAGTRTFAFSFKPGDVLPSPTQVTVEWGVSAVTENSQTNSNCASGCTVTLNLDQDIYLLRHTWKSAGGAQLAQSATRYLPVE